MKNEKLISLLKRLFENKEFEMTLTDVEHFYDGFNISNRDLNYDFKFIIL